MTYIVDPMWFYWLQAIGGLKILCGIMIFFAVSILIISWYMKTDNQCNIIRPNSIKNCLPVIISLFSIGLLGALFIPSRETLISMMVAKYATYENAQITVDTIKEVIDYIVKSIQSI